jgi:hypothetical protein
VSTRRLFLKGVLVGGAGLLVADAPSLLTSYAPAESVAPNMTLRLLTDGGVFEFPRVLRLDLDKGDILRCSDLVFESPEKMCRIDGLQAVVQVLGVDKTVTFNISGPVNLCPGNTVTFTGISVRLA